MAINGTLGSKLFISDSSIASTIDSEEEYMALNWTEIGLVENLGEFGRVFDLVSFQAVKDGRTYKLKGGFNDGNMQLTLGEDLGDSGQFALYTAARSSTQDNYGFRVELNDPPSTIGGPTTFFFRGLPMSYRSQLGAVNSVVRAMVSVEVNGDIISTPAAEIYDRFITGGSLSAYALFHGADTQAADPTISSNTLVSITGNAGTGFSDDGSQAISTTAFQLTNGALTVEARIKVSAITTVSIFFGLTDQVAALEIPIESAASSNAITTNASDAVGFMFDTDMGTDNIWFVGVNNNVDETSQNSGLAFVADTYRTLRMEANTSGDVNFFIDGVQVGSTMTTACRTNVNLYPTIAVGARTTSSRTLTSDYLYVRQD